MSTENEQSGSSTKQPTTRGGVPVDDNAKKPDFSGGRKEPASANDSAAVQKRSGVASDDKSKDFEPTDEDNA